VTLGRMLGRIGFVVGFAGPFLFYVSPSSWFSFESGFACPWCPYIDFAFPNSLTGPYLGLTMGLMSGLLLALVGFCTGQIVTLARGKNAGSVNPN